MISLLKQNNWDGYICTEFEGQRAWQDCTRDKWIDEVDQVRKNHEMLKRCIEAEL